MAKWRVLVPMLLLASFSGSVAWAAAQEGNNPDVTVFKVTVNMVQLDVAVTDKKGNYVTRLTPWDFAIYEDGIPQKIATFGEENEAPRKIEDYKPGESKPALAPSSNPKGHGHRNKDSGFEEASPAQVASLVAGANVFILFDTSNYMYRGFVFAQDAIAEFVRSLQDPARVAFYSYSRNFTRAALLTPERSDVIRAIRTTVAGDDAALYNSLLMTLRDAARLSGRKVVVVFSNGPDNASAVGPEDIREMSQTEGIPIYMISTQEARLDPISTAVFERVSATTGGKVYFAKNWKEQQDAFASIRDDLAHLYSISYYPAANPNRGWRSITVKMLAQDMKGYHVRTRSGYRPKAVRLTEQVKATS